MLLPAVLLVHLAAHAQNDTLRFATYNLLNYGNSANRPSVKNPNLSIVLNFIKPDLIGFNEISSALPALQDSLQLAFPYSMQHGALYNTTGTTQMNALFFRAGKFILLKDSSIYSELRDIVVYDLMYNDQLLSVFHDTIRLKVIVAHFKASNTGADKSKRNLEAQAISNYLDFLNQDANYVVMGDLNLYKSSELAYQTMINPPNSKARLNDPLDMAGDWDDDSSFSLLHTQSPRNNNLGDGGASGGLDSRFDFILVSDAVLNGSKGIRYAAGTYHTVGNDGLHFNKSMNDLPENMAAPAPVIAALYQHADHLPVAADFVFTPNHALAVAATTVPGAALPFSIQNPVRVDGAGLNWSATATGPFQYQLYDATGRCLQRGHIAPTQNKLDMAPVSTAGMYLLSVMDQAGHRFTYRLQRL